VSAEVDPEMAFRSEPPGTILVDKKFIAQSFERDDLTARGPKPIVSREDEAHTPFVDLEDLESVRDPVPDLCAHGHGGLPQDQGAESES
jgi:hypothetical protein